METKAEAIAYVSTVIASLLSPFVSVTLILWCVFGKRFLEKVPHRTTKAFQFRMIDSICLAVWIQVILAFFVAIHAGGPHPEYELSAVLGFSSFFIGVVVVIWWRVVAYLERHNIRSSLRRVMTELVFTPLVITSTIYGACLISGIPLHLSEMWVTEVPRDDEYHLKMIRFCTILGIFVVPIVVVLLSAFHAWIVNEPTDKSTA